MEWLRSCYSSAWFLFRDSAQVTRGYYYFADKNAPFYPGEHNLWSRNWVSDERANVAGLGEIDVEPQIYYKGSAPGGKLPDAVLIGSADCISTGDVYPPPTGRTLIDGVDVRCWSVPPTMTLTAKTFDGTVIVTAVSTIEFDQAQGFILTQGAVGDAKVSLGIFVPDADLTHRGLVNLAAQSMGAGPKFFSDKIGVGTASPLTNSALDVRGYTYAYFSGIISFGGGNTPLAESAGAILQYDGSFGNHNISLTIAAADYAPGHAGGLLIQGTNGRLLLRTRTALGKCFGYYNDDTSAYTLGVTGTTVTGDTVTGGLITGLGSAGLVTSVTASGVLSSSGGSTPNITLTGTVAVANGGTGSAAALAGGRVMVSSGSQIVEAGAMANGQLLIGSTGTLPSIASLTAGAGTGLVVTNGAGSITLKTSGASADFTVYSGAGFTATGTTQGAAKPLTTDVCNLTIPDPSNTAFILPSTPGFCRLFLNYVSGAMAAQIFPPTGGKINALGTNAANSMAANTQVEYWSTDAANLQWYTR